jgi:hypothetical protein
VLISVTGGAQDFRLPQNLQHAFERGLMRAARSGNTWCAAAPARSNARPGCSRRAAVLTTHGSPAHALWLDRAGSSPAARTAA